MTRFVTVTLNPAVDLSWTADAVMPTHKIRTYGERIDAGGGGINVARVLNAMGEQAHALIVAGGATGALIADMLTEAGLAHETIPCRGRTRISVTVTDRATSQDYRFVPLGPTAEPHDWAEVLLRLEEIQCDWIVASGSLEPGMPEDIYASIAQLARRRKIRFALDTSGPPLRAALESGVDLIKPSLRELEFVVGRPLKTEAEQASEAMALVRGRYAAMVAVTLGDQGALLASVDGVIRRPAIPVPFASTVGAGDSFMAGLIWSLSRAHSKPDALGWAIAAATAAVAKAGTARVQWGDVASWHGRLSG